MWAASMFALFVIRTDGASLIGDGSAIYLGLLLREAAGCEIILLFTIVVKLEIRVTLCRATIVIRGTDCWEILSRFDSSLSFIFSVLPVWRQMIINLVNRVSALVNLSWYFVCVGPLVIQWHELDSGIIGSTWSTLRQLSPGCCLFQVFCGVWPLAGRCPSLS